jgi:putative ABC transport system permease protein
MRRWFRKLIERRRIDAEARDEIAFHLEMETQRGIEAGLSPADARRRAQRDLGSALATRESVRDVRATWLDAIWQDVRFSLATLRRAPAFATMAVLVLGLGIGVNTAIFSLVNAAFFAPIPVERPEELVYLYQLLPSRQTALTGHRELDFLREHNDVFSGLTAHWARPLALTIGDEPTTAPGEIVTANYFDVLGVKPALGRTFDPAEDDVSTTGRAIVISDDLWARRFVRAPNALGAIIRIEGQPFTVVGIMPPGFHGLSDPWAPTDCWVPAAQIYGSGYRRFSIGTIGRMRTGVTLDQARAAIAVQNEQMWRESLARLSSSLRRSFGATERRGPNPMVLLPILDVRTPASPDDELVPIRLAASVAMVVALVLLVAAANIAGLLSARGLARAQEVAVRRALGASGARLVRQLTTEGVMLATAGGTVGLVLASWLLRLYRAYTPQRYVVAAAFDTHVLLFVLGLCVIVGSLVSIAPALQTRRINVVAMLTGTSGPTARSRRWLRHGIVVPQIAASLLLLLVAGMHLRTLAPIEMAHPGYDVEHVTVLSIGYTEPLSANFEPPSAAREAERAERARRFFRELTNRIEGVPNGAAIALASNVPTYDQGSQPPFTTSRDALAGGMDEATAAFATQVSAGYFKTLGIPLRQGRDFDMRDVRETTHVAIVSETVANRLWPGRSAIGRELAQYDPARPPKEIDWFTVVGVVGDTTPVLRPNVPTPEIYVPLSQQWRPQTSNLIVRSGSPSQLGSLRAAVADADPMGAVYRMGTIGQIIDDMLYPRRAATSILTVSGLIGLLLAAVGLYGIVSHAVAQRLREIAIRITVGADRRDVFALVLREGALVTLVGAALGLPLALVALRVTANLIGEVPRFDWLVLLVVPTIVALVVLAACYLPARRAANADPAGILRGL